ncbi:hypothetical protein [Glutamicibacter sp.]|jgi:F0F1-type ATP synthase, subunit b|uniref:hypothetical protein n=1 Tax=Glutamicibacter sp. TaxID=1931995 RepID=UPI002B4AA088|nr:hypothetical protein [Glutamicibacter sp.]HJX78284.1 hypothetical protein [Glutamicibacter sp.]
MSNDNFSSSTPSPYLPEPGSGQETLRPATPILRNDQFLPEHVDISDDLDMQDSTSQSNLSSDADTAKDLAQEGQHAAAEVLDTAKQEASLIGEQAKEQAADLFAELSSDLREQASLQQQKVATNLRDISDEFRTMLDQSQASGTAATLVDQASHHSGQIATWLDQREPGELVDEVKQFARKRPGAFLGIALGAGLLAGRITRNASASKQGERGSENISANSLKAPKGTNPVTGSPSPAAGNLAQATTPHSVSTEPQSQAPDETIDVDPLRSYPREDPRSEDYK